MMPPPSVPLALESDCECPDCALLQTVPPLPHNGEATCLRCDATLRRCRTNALTRATALCATALILYAVAITAPFLTVDIIGQKRATTMISLPAAFYDEGAWELALIVMATAIIAPLAKITVMLTVLLGIQVANPPAILPRAFKWYSRIGPWAMVEVFLLGVFVAFTRLRAIATVDVGIALYAVAALMLVMIAADYYLDQDEVWAAIEARGLVPPATDGPAADAIACRTCGRLNYAAEGARCTRCQARLWRRRPNSIVNTWALLAASAVLYIPANIFPILTLTRLGQGGPSTILGGAQELLEAGMWPLALLVFVASIMVPLLKLVSLTLMLITTQRGTAWRLYDRTRLYRLVDFIGRWSMIDVFMLATLVGLVRAGSLASINPGLGAICFGSVVVLTMLAAACFDPRRMWDAAGAQAPMVRPVPDALPPVPAQSSTA